METILQLDAVLDLLQSGQTVIAPSQAAAADLRLHFDLHQQALGGSAWEPPRLFSWRQWLESLWNALTLEGIDSRVVLNRLQEECLWGAELAPLAGLTALPSSTLRALARQASSGLALAASFQAVDRLGSAADSPDSRAFAAWYRAFESHCQANHLLSRALLADVLTGYFKAGHLAAPPAIHFIAFDQWNSSQSTLLEALQESGTTVHLHGLRLANTHGLQGSCVIPGDPQAELRWAVLWVRQYVTTNPNPIHPVALVLPDPEKERAQLEPLLREFLAPELEPVAQDLSSTPWHFSSGPSLGSQTMIRHALQLLRWTLGELSTDAIGALLLSPYLAQSDPFEERARFETQSLRRVALLRPEMTLPAFLKFAAKSSAKDQTNAGPLTLPEWRELQALLAKTPRSVATHGEWAEYLRKLLQTAGWPGSRTLSSAEFRLNEAWDGALDLLATLDLLGKRVSGAEFSALLSAEMQQIEPHSTNPGAVVQVLRPSETEGRLFGATLVLRATDDLWPAPESPHPFLGWIFQKSLGMPGTSASSAQRRSLALIDGLAARCSTLLLLSADHDTSGPLRLSELAGELPFSSLRAETQLTPEPPLAQVSLETVFDEAPLPTLPSYRIAGGARVLELQANCGFRAFASLRLSAAVPETRNLGGDPRESGQDLHKALEIFWQQTESQQALRALSPAERQTAVSAAVEAALDFRKRAQPAADGWTKAYLDVAKRRLRQLMLRWLETELLRGNFTVLQQEEKQLISVGPLELSVRPDRIDKVDGGLIFVDYKTSQALSADDWLGERPLAPQLPLYALLADPEEVRGLAFGRVRAGTDMGWISLHSEAGLFPRKGGTNADDLQEQVALWRTELTRLAEQFAAGFVNIDPKSYPKTCEFCQQRLLCRLNPESLLKAANEDLEQPEQENDHAR